MISNHIVQWNLSKQAEGYVRAIQWNLHYYYNGCKSWSWYYPHHFAPWITDIKGFSCMPMEFEMSKPFHPFEQLLSVLPAASKELLPKVFKLFYFLSAWPNKYHDFISSSTIWFKSSLAPKMSFGKKALRHQYCHVFVRTTVKCLQNNMCSSS